MPSEAGDAFLLPRSPEPGANDVDYAQLQAQAAIVALKHGRARRTEARLWGKSTCRTSVLSTEQYLRHVGVAFGEMHL